MSGGIDSSIAAAILKNKGYEVIGLFFVMHEFSRKNDAQEAADKLNIPLKIIDIKREFKKRVIDYFIKEYKTGRTPNPCVECNRWIKFRYLIEKASKLKVNYIATGHYVRTKNGKLFTAKDKQKDQSYFLWTLKQKQLKKILFPIGDYTKKEIREMAKNLPRRQAGLPAGRQGWDLPVFEKKESQEICFIPDADLRGFLESQMRAERGSIITVDGKKVGEHKGLAFYTIGQRKGIEIGGIGPFYVVSKDFKNNVLIVAKSEYAPELYKKEMIVEKINWISEKPKFPLQCKVKIRYLHPAVSAIIYKIQNTKYQIRFAKPQRAITPGQSAVFYSRNEVLGGGIIT